MRMLIKSMHIFTTDGEESIINFSDSLTFVYGNVGAGKSTMINLIMYGLGNTLIYTPAVKSCFQAVQIEVVLKNKPFSFFRMTNSNRIQIDDITEKRRYSLLQNQVSSFLYNQFSLPDLYLSIGNIAERNVKLSIVNFCWFSYLKQSEMDNSFFNLDSDNIYKQNAAVNALFSFFESTFLIHQKSNKKYRELKRRLRQFEDGSEVFNYIEKIFNESETIKSTNTREDVRQLKHQIAGLIAAKDNYSREDIFSFLETQKLLNQTEYRLAFEMRRERYNKEIERLRDEMAGTASNLRTDYSMDNPNVKNLYDLFLDCLINVGFHGVTEFDTVRMDPKTFMPILINPYENRKVSFDNLGSGGKKTLFKICFALAIHRLQHAKKEMNYLPSFLMIDTPMKNISEREDVEMYNRFYKYLFRLFSTELSDTQLFVVDKEERDLSSYKFREDVILMHMTHDDIMHPPLFRNYKGL